LSAADRLHKDFLDARVKVRIEGAETEITRREAVLNGIVKSAVQGNAHSQWLWQKEDVRIAAAQREADLARTKFWLDYQSWWKVQILNAAYQNKDLPTPQIHPDDISFAGSGGVVRIYGPVTAEGERLCRQGIAARDAWILQAGLEMRSGAGSRRKVDAAREALQMARLLDAVLPFRLRLSEDALADRFRAATAQAKRLLLRDTHQAWKAAGLPKVRGWRLEALGWAGWCTAVLGAVLKSLADLAAQQSDAEIFAELDSALRELPWPLPRSLGTSGGTGMFGPVNDASGVTASPARRVPGSARNRIAILPTDLRAWLDAELAAAGYGDLTRITETLNRRIDAVAGVRPIGRSALHAYAVTLRRAADEATVAEAARTQGALRVGCAESEPSDVRVAREIVAAVRARTSHVRSDGDNGEAGHAFDKDLDLLIRVIATLNVQTSRLDPLEWEVKLDAQVVKKEVNEAEVYEEAARILGIRWDKPAGNQTT
jgi:hypothetical protein